MLVQGHYIRSLQAHTETRYALMIILIGDTHMLFVVKMPDDKILVYFNRIKGCNSYVHSNSLFESLI